MTKVNRERLAEGRDPDSLLSALYEISEPDPELRESLLRLLEHADPDVRAEAVRVLIRRWNDRSARQHAFRLLTDDPDEEVREAAVYAIAGTSTAETKHTDTETLLTLVREEEEPLRIRSAAYDALLIINRRADFPPKTRAFDPRSDIDWEWLTHLE